MLTPLEFYLSLLIWFTSLLPACLKTCILPTKTTRQLIKTPAFGIRLRGKEAKVPRKRPPAQTPEARENQLIAAAVDLAEQQLRDGTASPSVITHFLKLASTKQQLEVEKLKSETEFLRAKAEAVQSNQRSEELYAEAIAAMKRYSGVQEEYYEEEVL